MKTVVDMLGRSLTCPVSPRRIVSLCPSITETLFSLGLDEQIVGVTRYCLHPDAGVEKKAKVGGTKRLNFGTIDQLDPDLIIAEKEENLREDVERLSSRYPVYVTEVQDIDGAHNMMLYLGEVCNRVEEAQALSTNIRNTWARLTALPEPKRVAYLIWKKPYMAAGSQTYIDAVLQRMGFENVFAESSRYPEFTLAQLKDLQPEVVLLSSEPYPFKEKHLEEIEAELPAAEVLLVDGEAFSWYGSHMLGAAKYLARLHHLLT